MLFKRHPSHAALLSVLNHTAPAEEQKLIMAHLTTCVRCRTVADSYEATLSDLNVFGRSRQSSGDARTKAHSFRNGRIFWSLAIRVSVGIITVAFFALMFLWFRHLQPVDAAELLSRAEAAQAPAKANEHHYRLQLGKHAGAAICNTADERWARSIYLSTHPCGCVHNALIKAHWNNEAMLSVRSYRQWHDQLARHRDSVLHEEQYWTIKTDTDQGILQSASLRLRSSDFRPVELTLEFANLEPISVMEW